MASMRRGWPVLLAAAMIFAPDELCGRSLYEQAPTISGGLFSNAGGLLAADQFVLKEAAVITAVRWYGFFQSASIVLSEGELAGFRFRISFFEDGSGVPGRQISRQDVSVRVRNTGVRTRLNIPDKLPTIYEFTAATLQPVAVNVGASVWISISAVEAPALWLWSRSVAGVTDTLAVKDEARNQSKPLDWKSNGKFGQLAFTLITGLIGDLPLSRPGPAPRPSLKTEGPSKPFTSGSIERPPTVAVRSEPQYTAFARLARVSGTVVLDSVLRKDGSLSIMRVVEGLGFGLDETAQSALQDWRFNPLMRDGRRVDTRLYLEINFK
jgi:TonB family protein